MTRPGNDSYNFEPRWPVALAIATGPILLSFLPGRISPFPRWFPYVLGIAMFVPMVSVWVTNGNVLWRRLERVALLFFFVVAGISVLLLLADIVNVVFRGKAEIGGAQLLASSLGLWINNLLTFSLLYWDLDRGGPEARVNNLGNKPDWLFPQDGAPGSVRSDWRPTFVDYLYLGFSTATAFSATDALPLTARAKLLMMLESSISLVTLVVVVSRAMNILGS